VISPEITAFKLVSYLLAFNTSKFCVQVKKKSEVPRKGLQMFEKQRLGILNEDWTMFMGVVFFF